MPARRTSGTDMDRTVQVLDTAIGAVKNGRDHLRHDPKIEPADLSAVIGTLRELVWTIDTFTAVLIDTYSRQTELEHDNGADPVEAIQRITARLGQVRCNLDTIDGALGDSHNIAAKLFRRQRSLSGSSRSSTRPTRRAQKQAWPMPQRC